MDRTYRCEDAQEPKKEEEKETCGGCGKPTDGCTCAKE